MVKSEPKRSNLTWPTGPNSHSINSRIFSESFKYGLLDSNKLVDKLIITMRQKILPSIMAKDQKELDFDLKKLKGIRMEKTE